ncbi:MBL fold metallo-hydrolase, partial [Actinophytocola sp.]|uniref:MBL fold metallo-hydrolase n=1 Tax=Actinophytocola sp. TaxID=1872138 RepID=UPI002ED976AF
AYPESWQKVRENSRVRFHEWPDVGGSVTAGHYSVRAVQVQHTIAPALGYIVGDGTATAGFSGDSELCAGIDNIMLESSAAVLDASFIEQRSGHMGATDLMKIAHRFPQVRVIATHMSDEVREHTWPGVELPSDGDCYHI